MPEVKTSIRPPRDAMAKTAVHNPALKKPAIAEQPATSISRQASTNSTKGFIQCYFNLLVKIIVPQIFSCIDLKK